MDSLKCSWEKEFKLNKKIDYIIGNPPYINTHDMQKDYIKFLKTNYNTTKQGCFNIFYAFIEKSMEELDENGKAGFIIPNNFINISAAIEFRKYLKEKEYLQRLIDLGENMVFSPVRTYNSIMFLSKTHNKSFEYKILEKQTDLIQELRKDNYLQIQYKDLIDEQWHLLDKNTKEIIKNITKQNQKIGNMIKTGIATLKDDLYMIQDLTKGDKDYCIKEYKQKEFLIERKIVKKILKISKIKDEESIETNKLGIIFPYKKDGEKNIIIEEKKLMKEFPKTYRYLCEIKEELHKRDKGKSKNKYWYEYGRNQGINNSGYKLIYPTFSNKPKFMLDTTDTLICNGYALYSDNIEYIKCIQKILNSNVLDFYMKKTSYSIKGGYMCYQKKFIKDFTIPEFSQELTKSLLENENEDKLNEKINKLYNI